MARITSKFVAVAVSLCVGLCLATGADAKTKKKRGEFTVPPHTLWVTKLKKEKIFNRRPYQFATPVFSGGRMYVGAQSGYFYALGARYGKKYWRQELKGSVMAAGTIYNDAVVIPTAKGYVYLLALKDGSIRWQVEVGQELLSKPLIVDNKIYLASTSRQLSCVDATTGAVLWQTPKEGVDPELSIKGTGDPVYYNGSIYVGYSDGRLVSYNAADGTKLTDRMMADIGARFTDIDSTPLFQDGFMYVVTVNGKLIVTDIENGATLWTADYSTPNDLVVDDKFVYVAGKGRLSVLNKDTGIPQWEQDLGTPEISAPVIVRDWVAVASTQDKIYLINKNTGDIVYQRFIRRGTFGKLAYDREILYVLSNSARMFALGRQ